jgi:putative transposase
MGRGYVDYNSWEQLTQQGVYFLMRLKKDTLWNEVESRKPPQNSNVIRDQIIRIRPSERSKIETKFRIVTILDEEGEELSFLTNHLDLGARTIAKIYKDR